VDAKEGLFCAHNRLLSDADFASYGQRIKVLSEHATPEGSYHCCGGGAGCALYKSLGCWPKIAECRYASQQEPKKGAYDSEPKIVNGVYCLGEDFCVREECKPEPRLSF